MYGQQHDSTVAKCRRVVKAVLLMLMAILQIVSTGCGGDSSQENWDRETNGGNDNSGHQVLLSRTAFAEKIPHQKEDIVELLWADGQRLLYSVTGICEEQALSGGSEYVSKEVGIYDTCTQTRKKIETTKNIYYVTGCISTDGIALCGIEPSTGKCCIFWLEEDGELQLIDHFVNPVDMPPEFALMDTGEILFSYEDICNQNRPVFGVKELTRDGNLQPLKTWYIEQGTSFLSSSLSTNGRQFLYFLEENSRGVFLISSLNGDVGKVEMAADQRYNNAVILDEGILLSLSESGRQKLIWSDFSGKVLAQEELGPYYRMESDGENTVIMTDSFFTNHIISVKGVEISITDISADSALDGALDGTPVVFQHSGDREFWMNYIQSNQLVHLSFYW